MFRQIGLCTYLNKRTPTHGSPGLSNRKLMSPLTGHVNMRFQGTRSPSFLKPYPSLNTDSIRLYHTSGYGRDDKGQENRKKSYRERTEIESPRYIRRIFRAAWRSLIFYSPRLLLKTVFKRRSSPLKDYQRQVDSPYYYEQQEPDPSPQQHRWAQEEFYKIKKFMALEVNERDKELQEIKEWFQTEMMKAAVRHNKVYLDSKRGKSNSDQNSLDTAQDIIKTEDGEREIKDHNSDNNETNITPEGTLNPSESESADTEDIKSREELHSIMIELDNEPTYISYSDTVRIANEFQRRILEVHSKRYHDNKVEDEMYEGRQRQRIIIQEEKIKQAEAEKAKKKIEEDETKADAKDGIEEEASEAFKELTDQYKKQLIRGKRKRQSFMDIGARESITADAKEDVEVKKKVDDMTLLKEKYSPQQLESISYMTYANLKPNSPMKKFNSTAVMDREIFLELSNSAWGDYIIDHFEPEIGMRPLLMEKDSNILIRPSFWSYDDIYCIMGKRGDLLFYQKINRGLEYLYSDRLSKRMFKPRMGEVLAIPCINDELLFFIRNHNRAKSEAFFIPKGVIFDSDAVKKKRKISYPPMSVFKPFTVKDAIFVMGVESESDAFYKIMFYDYELDSWREVNLDRKIPYYQPGPDVLMRKGPTFWTDGTMSLAINDDESKIYILAPMFTNSLLIEIDTDTWTSTFTFLPIPSLVAASCAVDNDKLLICGGHTPVVTSQVIVYVDLETKKCTIPNQYGNSYPFVGDASIFKITDGHFSLMGGTIFCPIFDERSHDEIIIKYPLQPTAERWVIQTVPDPEGLDFNFFVVEGEEEVDPDDDDLEDDNGDGDKEKK